MNRKKQRKQRGMDRRAEAWLVARMAAGLASLAMNIRTAKD